MIPRLGASLAKLTQQPRTVDDRLRSLHGRRAGAVGPARRLRAASATATWRSRGFSTTSGAASATRWSGRPRSTASARPTCPASATTQKPKAQMLGVRGFPGNSINHANSFSCRAITAGCSSAARSTWSPRSATTRRDWPGAGRCDVIDIRLIVTDLCVLDFKGPERRCSVRSLHPGVSVEQVQDNTGFPLHVSASCPRPLPPDGRAVGADPPTRPAQLARHGDQGQPARHRTA